MSLIIIPRLYVKKDSHMIAEKEMSCRMNIIQMKRWEKNETDKKIYIFKLVDTTCINLYAFKLKILYYANSWNYLREMQG